MLAPILYMSGLGNREVVEKGSGRGSGIEVKIGILDWVAISGIFSINV